MSILDKLIEEIPSDDKLEVIKELCRQIQEEEDKSIIEARKRKMPAGPNVFLTVEVPGIKKREVSYLALERESEDKYLAVLSSIFIKDLHVEDKNPKRVKVWEISQIEPRKILIEFAKVVKFLRGE